MGTHASLSDANCSPTKAPPNNEDAFALTNVASLRMAALGYLREQEEQAKCFRGQSVGQSYIPNESSNR